MVLNACQSARGDSHDVFGGMAQGLVQFSVSAVAAMQFPISDGAASTFSRALYGAIAKGHPVDQAMTSARKSLLLDFPSEWATPVLYLRSEDGVIFELPKTDDVATLVWPSQPTSDHLRHRHLRHRRRTGASSSGPSPASPSSSSPRSTPCGSSGPSRHNRRRTP